MHIGYQLFKELKPITLQKISKIPLVTVL